MSHTKEFWQDRVFRMEEERTRIIEQIERIKAGPRQVELREHLLFLDRLSNRLEEARVNCQICESR